MAGQRPQTAKRSKFSVGVLVPVTVSLVMTVTVTLAFVLWSAQGIDQRSLDRQTQLARHVIDVELARIPHDQESVTIWDDAVVSTQLDFDRRWVDVNLGTWMSSFFGHDEVIVLDADDQPVYAMVGGRQDTSRPTKGELDALQPLIAQVRRASLATDPNSVTSGGKVKAPHASDLVIIGGAPAIVSIAPIVSDSGKIAQQRGSEYLHVSMVHLDDAFANRIGSEYLIPGLRFGNQLSSDSTASLPLTNAAGRFVTFLEWEPSTPGRAMLSQTMPAIIGAFAVAAVIALLLLHQLWRKSRDLERGRADAAYQALHDPLTGLPNRASFETDLGRALAQRPSRDRRVSLLMLDLDRFKRINDTLGHQAGDDLLEAVSQRLAQFCQPGGTLARLGGDEFGLIHIHGAGQAEPVALSQTIIEAVGKPFLIVGGEAFVGLSIGIATADGDEADGDEADARELARRADIALYEAKSAGRNRAVIFEEPMNRLLQNRHTIEAELREALRRVDQLSVAFQPLVGRGGRIIGAEALARWQHPRLGQVSPAHFIPVAEASGLVEDLGRLILREACRMGARWPGYILAVNISPVQLRNPTFPKVVFDMLAETGMSASSLELEITEGILLEDASEAADALRVFRAAGIRIALDDFGTGYSSLNYLKRYPVDRIKIDRSFVSQLMPGNVSVAIVQAMVTLAHALGIEVTAEGVETKEQLDTLTALGCNAFQGYLLSPPVAPEVLAVIFEQPDADVRVA